MKKHVFQIIMTLIVAFYGAITLAEDASVKTVDDKVSLNFVDADIESVLKAIGQITNKNFLLDPKVKGTISINTAKPVPRALTYNILLSALRVQGFAAVEENGYTAIVPEVDAKGKFTPRMTSSRQLGGQIVTQVYMLKYESASQLINVIKPLLSPNSVVTAYPSSNALIVTDYADNLNKIIKLIDTIDKPSQAENVLVRLKYASAVEITQTINRLLADTANAADPSRRILAIADARSNAIILHAENQTLISHAAKLIEQLDVPTNAGSSIHVVYLKNADSTKLATTLRALLSGKAAQSTLSPTNVNTSQPVVSGDITKNITTTQPINQANTASPFSQLASAQENDMIQADAATNSLLITAPDHVFNMLRGVIDKLDMRRAQLYIEALIAEISTDKASEFGIQWQDLEALNDGTLNRNNIQGFGGTKFNRGGNILGVSSNITSAGSGLNIGLLKGKINVPGIGVVANLGLLAHALESNANANILSKPNLLMLDNEEAKIVIGQNVPFVTGQYAQTGGASSVTPFQTIERQDVGLTLKVKPQISEGNTVKLQIHQEVSSVLDSAGNAGITTNKRSIDTSVLVDDGSIIVLGGLIEDRISDNVEKVPFLGDIPGLGALFRTVGKSHKKTNLMVFLRPYVMRSPEDSSLVSNDRYDYIIQQQKDITQLKVWPLPDTPVVTLPDRFESKLKVKAEKK